MSTLRERFLVWLAHDIGLPYFKIFRKHSGFPYSLEELQSLPEHTVGNALSTFFSEHQLDLLQYYERHDIKHVVLDFPPTAVGEVAMQYFVFGNGKISFPILIVLLFGLLLMPDYYATFFSAFYKGFKTHSMRGVNWFSLIPMPLQEARRYVLQQA